MGLELNTGEDEEAIRAARRARRKAILAKYADDTSTTTRSVSASPGPSSAVQPPKPVSSISDLQSQPYSAAVTPGAITSGHDTALQMTGTSSTHLLIDCNHN